MRSGQTRFVLAALAVAVFWGLVYWSAPAARDGGVRMASAEEAASGAARPEDKRLALQDGAKPIGTERDIAPLVQRAPAQALPSPKSPAEAPTGAPNRTGVVAPQFREHVVRPGQTLLSIAKDEYGDSRRWEAISRANPRIDPLKLRAGAVLRIPIDPRNVQGKTVEIGERTPPAAAAITQYTVKAGDTLGGIAERTMGSSRAWESILRANRSLLNEPEDLRPGMTLTIPPTP